MNTGHFSAPARKRQMSCGEIKSIAMEAFSSTGALEKPATVPRRSPPKLLPQYRVILHNDDINEMGFVVRTIIELTPLEYIEAVRKMYEAHYTGCSQLLITHRERAELHKQQFQSKGLIVTIEPE
jgi:ATP-dependent Clp protease adaptor protein ClpS